MGSAFASLGTLHSTAPWVSILCRHLTSVSNILYTHQLGHITLAFNNVPLYLFHQHIKSSGHPLLGTFLTATVHAWLVNVDICNFDLHLHPTGWSEDCPPHPVYKDCWLNSTALTTKIVLCILCVSLVNMHGIYYVINYTHSASVVLFTIQIN